MLSLMARSVVCSASAASAAAADRIGQAFGATDTTGLLAGGDAGATVEVDIPQMQQSRVIAAEQKINTELEAARASLQQLSRLQAAAQEVRSVRRVAL